MSVRTRIAPSPTGDPHVGTLYIALFNYVFARHFGGKFILRIEDTDQTRSLPIYEKNIYEALSWGKLSWDEGPDIGGEYGPYRQSERLKIYQEQIQILLKNKTAYKCFATPEELEEMRLAAKISGSKLGYDRRYRNLSDNEVKEREKAGQKYVIRLKVPLTGECVFEDKVKGRITCPWADVDDQILMKSDGFPTYHFANVVDDHLMKITHVIRGDEWITSTPKHVLLYESFGWTPPVFMHLPLLLGKDGRKLSKRRNPTSVFYFRDSGFLPSAMINFLSLIGYSMKEEDEIFSLDKLIKEFDPTRFGKSGAFFDIKKLEWLNQKYIIDTLSEKELLEKIKKLYLNDEFLSKIIPLAHTRIKTFGDFFDLCDFLFKNNVNYSDEILLPKNMEKEEAASLLHMVIWGLEEKQDWSGEALEKTSHELAEFLGLNHKKAIIPLLFGSIMGKSFGPPLFASAEILGKEKLRARLLNSIEFLGGVSNKKMAPLKESWEKKDFSSYKKS
jgi:glutamyl-tRNA synthetase